MFCLTRGKVSIGGSALEIGRVENFALFVALCRVVRLFGLMLVGCLLAALLVRLAEYKAQQSISSFDNDNPSYYRGAF